MSSRRTSSVPKDVIPRMLYCDSRCSQTLTGLSPALPGALLCNATRRLGDGQRVIIRHRVRGSVRAVRAVRNTRVFQTETGVVAEVPGIDYYTHREVFGSLRVYFIYGSCIGFILFIVLLDIAHAVFLQLLACKDSPCDGVEGQEMS